MLIDTSVTIAYKCSSCGTFEFFSVSLFELLHKKELRLSCRCNKSSIFINVDSSKNYKINIPCISCGKGHIFALRRKDILYKNINVFYCPESGLQQCFIGNDAEVRSRIDTLEKEFDELISMFGYENYFKNTQVMFDSLNRIHDIAEQGNLYCECGNADIGLALSSDRILLKCKRCSGSKVIYASSNEDLKNVLIKQQIILTGDCQGSDISAGGPGSKNIGR